MRSWALPANRETGGGKLALRNAAACPTNASAQSQGDQRETQHVTCESSEERRFRSVHDEKFLRRSRGRARALRTSLCQLQVCTRENWEIRPVCKSVRRPC